MGLPLISGADQNGAGGHGPEVPFRVAVRTPQIYP
jgi:hypothetical protein